MRTIYITLISLVSFIILPGTAKAQVNAEQVMTIGRNVLSMDDYLLSIQYFNQAIKAKPYMAEPYFYRALAKLQLEDYAGALQDCNEALSRNKYITEAYKLRGFARMNLGQDSLAVIDYDYGLKYDPTDKYFMFYKGIAESQLKRYDDAQHTFAELLRQYPKFEEGYASRAYNSYLKGDTIAALEDIDRALGINKSVINCYLMRAEIYAQKEEWENAAKDLDKAVELRPQDVNLYINRAYLRYNLQNFFGAMADYNYALELEPDNETATYNRALLRTEVRDYDNAVADFTHALTLDPSNFYAIYNRAIIYYKLGEYRKALADFDQIQKRYPKFYPVYYAKAEVYQRMGNTRAAFDSYYKGEELVKGYVTNPTKNPLDKPTIQKGKTYKEDELAANKEETEVEVMERFNQLKTVSGGEEPILSYNDRIKGRVQDRNMRIEPEPMYVLSLYDNAQSLRNVSNYFREIDEINQQHYLPQTLYLTNSSSALNDALVIDRLFKIIEDYTTSMSKGTPRPVDYLGRGVVYSMLKNYEGALADLNKALAIDPSFTAALMARGAVSYVMNAQNATNAIADFDSAAELNPRLIYAWFNKGVILYEMGDYTSALQCFTKALEIDPAFGEAYYNRGLCYFQAGNKQPALQDLSRAGELGIPDAYNLLKRMK